MSQSGQGQEYGNEVSPKESGEWKVPVGILVLKTTTLPSGVTRSIELGVIRESKKVDGKSEYIFISLASVFHSSEGKNTHVGKREEIDVNLNTTGKYVKDRLSIEYKNLLKQVDMFKFLENFKPTTLHLLFNTLSDRGFPYPIKDSNKLLFLASIERVIEGTPPHNHDHR